MEVAADSDKAITQVRYHTSLFIPMNFLSNDVFFIHQHLYINSFNCPVWKYFINDRQT